MSSMPRVLLYSSFFNTPWVELLKITSKSHFLVGTELCLASIIPEMLDGSLSVVHSFSQQMCIKHLLIGQALQGSGSGGHLGSGQDKTVTSYTSIKTLHQGKIGKTKTKGNSLNSSRKPKKQTPDNQEPVSPAVYFQQILVKLGSGSSVISIVWTVMRPIKHLPSDWSALLLSLTKMTRRMAASHLGY